MLAISPSAGARRVAGVSVVLGFSAGTQFLFQVLWAVLVGSGATLDVILIVTAIMSVLGAAFIVSLPATLVPLLFEVDEDVSRDLESRAIMVCFALGTGLAALAYISARPLLSVVAPGLSASSIDLGARLLRVEVLSLPLVALSSALTGSCYYRERFVLAPLGRAFGGAVACAAMVVMMPRFGVMSIAWAVVFAACTQLTFVAPTLRELAWPRGRFWQPHLWIFLRRLLPLTTTGLLARIDVLIDGAIGSLLGPGTITCLGYARRIAEFFHQLVGSSLETTQLPRMARLARTDRSGFARWVGFLIELVLVFAILALVLLGGLAVAHRGWTNIHIGALDESTLRFVVLACLLHFGVFLAGPVGSVVATTYYAERNTRTPIIISSSCILLGAGIKFALSGPLGFRGVALGTSFSLIAIVVLGIAVLRSRGVSFPFRPLFQTMIKLLFSGSLAVVFAYLVVRGLSAWPALVIGPAVAGVVFLILTRNIFISVLVRPDQHRS